MKLLNRHPQRRGAGALTFVEVVIVTVIVSVLLAIVLMQHGQRRARAERINCVNQLRSLGIAFRGFGIDLGGFPAQVSVTNGGTMELVGVADTKAFGGIKAVWPHFQVLSNEINNPKILLCPADKLRTPAASFATLSDSNISYFLSVDSSDTMPNAFLAGDANLLVGGQPARPGLLVITSNAPVAWSRARHDRQGNVLLGDGSVQSLSSTMLNRALAGSGLTNRLLMP